MTDSVLEKLARARGLVLSGGEMIFIYQRALEIGKDPGYCRLLHLPAPDHGLLTDKQFENVLGYVLDERRWGA
jgi:hypothetical protein